MAEPVVVACRASADYKLWLRFSDGLAGAVYLGNLLESGAFKLWRDPAFFEDVRIRDGAIVWGHAGSTGVSLDPDILYYDIAARGGLRHGKTIGWSEQVSLAREIVRKSLQDPAFQRFMTAALTPPPKHRRRRRP